MADQVLDSDMLHALEDSAAAAAELRALNGGGRQDLKTIQECGELAEACSKYSRALAQRLGHYDDGGKRGDVDKEKADVLQLLLGSSPPGSDVWTFLRQNTEHVRKLIREAKEPRPVPRATVPCSELSTVELDIAQRGDIVDVVDGIPVVPFWWITHLREFLDSKKQGEVFRG